MKLFIAGLLFILLMFPANGVEPELRLEGYLHTNLSGGFIEYDFQKDGTLISYEYIKDGTSSGPNVVDGDLFGPRFRVDFLRWEIVNDRLTIYRGNKKSVSTVTRDAKYWYFHENTWERVGKLRFFEVLRKETGQKE